MIDAKHYELFETAMRVLDTVKTTAAGRQVPITQQTVIEMLMAWQAQKAGERSDMVIDAMARHAKQLIGTVRGKM
jgi:hypothetical protein